MKYGYSVTVKDFHADPFSVLLRVVFDGLTIGITNPGDAFSGGLGREVASIVPSADMRALEAEAVKARTGRTKIHLKKSESRGVVSWLAWVGDDSPGDGETPCGQGEYPTDAIGKLVYDYPELFGIELT